MWNGLNGVLSSSEREREREREERGRTHVRPAGVTWDRSSDCSDVYFYIYAYVESADAGNGAKIFKAKCAAGFRIDLGRGSNF